jgi:uncharacterized protein (TIGR00369 family)
MDAAENVASLNRLAEIGLAGMLGLRFVDWTPHSVTARFAAGVRHLAPNERVHGGAIVTLADTTCGNGTIVLLGGRMDAFATIELSCHFLRAPATRELECVAHLVHAGRTLHHWDAEIRGAGRLCARFRCTQIVLDVSGHSGHNAT